MKIFRAARMKNITTENKVTKYLIYASGEIFLVVVGILIALQINNWKESIDDNTTRDSYIEGLLKDFNHDLDNINTFLIQAKDQIQEMNKQADRIFSEDATIDTIIQIARHEFDVEYGEIEYSKHTSKRIFSSEDEDLFEHHLIRLLMELDEAHRLQSNETKDNTQGFTNQMSSYYRSYSPSHGYSKNNIVDKILWTNIDENEFVGKFRGMLFMKLQMVQESSDQLEIVKAKTKKTISYLEKRKAFYAGE